MRKKLLLLCVFPLVFHGRIIEMRNRNTFWTNINKHDIVIAQIFNLERSCKDKCYRNTVNQLKNRFAAISKNQRYNYAELTFISMNVSQCPHLQRELGIASLPALKIFVNGKPWTGELTGFVNEPRMINFIDSAIGNEIQNLVKAHCEYDKKWENARISAYANSAFGWGWGYPYYGYGWGSYGFGYGLGYGRGWWW